MEWTAPIDIYCERTGPEFWSEPINAISNLSFFIAALIAYVAAKRADRLEPLTILMIAMAVIVGTGSFLFHSYATLWAAYADTIPILIFILIQIYTVVRRYLAKPVWLALLAPVLFVIFTFGFDAAWASALPSINGSEIFSRADGDPGIRALPQPPRPPRRALAAGGGCNPRPLSHLQEH